MESKEKAQLRKSAYVESWQHTCLDSMAGKPRPLERAPMRHQKGCAGHGEQGDRGQYILTSMPRLGLRMYRSAACLQSCPPWEVGPEDEGRKGQV